MTTRSTGGYLDLATLYRNVIKERALVREPGILYVMVKGGDWRSAANSSMAPSWPSLRRLRRTR